MSDMVDPTPEALEELPKPNLACFAGCVRILGGHGGELDILPVVDFVLDDLAIGAAETILDVGVDDTAGFIIMRCVVRICRIGIRLLDGIVPLVFTNSFSIPDANLA